MYGVSNAETLQGLKNLMERADARGSTLTPDHLASYASMISRSKELGVANPDSALQAIQEGFGNATGGRKIMVMQALGMGDPSRRLKGSEVGFSTEAEVADYDNYLKSGNIDLATGLLLGEYKDSNPIVTEKLNSGVQEQFGGRTDLIDRMLLEMGLSPEQVATMRGNPFGSPLDAGNRTDEYSRSRYKNAVPEDVGQKSRFDEEGRPYEYVEIGYMQEILSFRQKETDAIWASSAAIQSALTDWEEFDTTMRKGFKGLAEGAADVWNALNGETPINRDGPDYFQEQNKEDREFKGAYNPSEPFPGAYPTETPPNFSGADVIPRLMEANFTAESGGNPQAINSDTGALGLYQIMPANFAGEGGWDKRYLGRDITPNEFLDNPDLQHQMAQGEMRRLYESLDPKLSVHERAARTTAAWYGGPDMLEVPSSDFSDTPNYSNGNQYPSMKDHVNKVLKIFEKTTPQEPEGSSNSRQEIVVKFEGEGIRLLGDHPLGKFLETGIKDAVQAFYQNPTAEKRRGGA